MTLASSAPAAQKQIVDKRLQDSRFQAAGMTGGGRKDGSKYHNTPTERKTGSGAILRFDSKREAARYDELMLMLKAGEIRDLRLQPEYTLQEAYTTSEGERVGRIYYRADFCYERCGKRSGGREWWEAIVEDVKGHRTDVYKMKKKMMLERHGIEIQEV